MKKLVFLVMTFLVFTFPILAQELVSEEVPLENLTLKKGNIPPQIVKAAEQLFQGSTQVAWGVFPYELKDYGWAVNKDYNEPIDHYELQIKGKDGSDIFAVFESTGELIRYKVINKNAPIPKLIMNAIEKSEYKDWKIVGDAMLIKNNQKKVVEHYAVKLEKGNLKKTLYYTAKGENLTVKQKV
jgi:hypothetical protein